MTFDAMSNSLNHSQLNTRKFGRRIYQKSLKAFLQVPLQFCSKYSEPILVLLIQVMKTSQSCARGCFLKSIICTVHSTDFQ